MLTQTLMTGTLLRNKGNSPVVSYVEGVEALGEALHVVGTDLLQEVDVVLRVEAAHVVLGRLVRLEHLHRELMRF